MILQATAWDGEVLLQAWSDVNVHGDQFRLVIIPYWNEVHTLVATSANVTDEVKVSVSSILDIVTSIAQLARRVCGLTVVSSVSTFREVVDIETWTTETATEAWNTAELGVSVDSLTVGSRKSPLVRAAALSFSNSVESLLTDFVSLFHIDDSVSSWTAAGAEDGAAVLLDLLTASVIINHDNLFHLGKFGQTRSTNGTLLIRLTVTRHVVLDHF